MKKEGVDPKLVSYLKKQFSKGVSLSSIKHRLLASGWSEDEIRKAVALTHPRRKSYVMIVSASILILAFIIGIFFISPLKKTVSEYKPSAFESSITLNEVYERAAEEGTSFCDKLTTESLKNDCVFIAVKSEAERTKNPDVCDTLKSSDMVRGCKVPVVLTEVVLKYKEESKTSGEDVVPSNIDLCDKLDDPADREACRNPKQVLSDCPYGVCYK
ncbi:MAG: hypothetical protein QXR60_00725 [Candidatus Nanoarchaeia archaeon]